MAAFVPPLLMYSPSFMVCLHWAENIQILARGISEAVRQCMEQMRHVQQRFGQGTPHAVLSLPSVHRCASF